MAGPSLRGGTPEGRNAFLRPLLVRPGRTAEGLGDHTAVRSRPPSPSPPRRRKATDDGKGFRPPVSDLPPHRTPDDEAGRDARRLNGKGCRDDDPGQRTGRGRTSMTTPQSPSGCQTVREIAVQQPVDLINLKREHVKRLANQRGAAGEAAALAANV